MRRQEEISVEARHSSPRLPRKETRLLSMARKAYTTDAKDQSLVVAPNIKDCPFLLRVSTHLQHRRIDDLVQHKRLKECICQLGVVHKESARLLGVCDHECLLTRVELAIVGQCAIQFVWENCRISENSVESQREPRGKVLATGVSQCGDAPLASSAVRT